MKELPAGKRSYQKALGRGVVDLATRRVLLLQENDPPVSVKSVKYRPVITAWLIRFIDPDPFVRCAK